MDKQKYCVLSLSGGADSSSLLIKLLADGYNVTALSYDIGQKHKVELERATQLVQYINSNPSQGWLSQNYKPVKHQIIKLDGLSNLLVSGLINNNSMELKLGHYAHENALTSVVPNRNSIFAAITYAVALSIVKQTGEPCKIALGTHMGDYNNKIDEKTGKVTGGIYPDCSEEFRIALEHAFKIGNWDSEKVDYYAPYNVTDKTGVLKDGIENCNKIGLNWREVYKRTNTSYAPIKVGIGFSATGECFEWLSDYKSGSSIERIESFIKLGLEDPLQYAEEDGTLVSWDFIKEYVENICKEFIGDH